MKNLKNRVQLIGNVGKEPVYKSFDSGKTMTSLSVATTENYIDNNDKKVTDTQWHQLVAWNKTAEFINKYVSKGTKLAIEGKLVHRTYTDTDGQVKYITEVTVQEVLLLDNKGEA